MSIRFPEEIKGSGRMESWLNRLLRACISSRVVDGPQIRPVPGTHGTALEITQGIGSASKESQFVLKEILDDMLRCRAIDGNGAEGTSDVFIAKSPRLRRTPFDGETIAFSSDGESYSVIYAYTSSTKRTVTIAGVPEVQVVIPRFKIDFDLIYAMPCSDLGLDDPNGSAVQLIDQNLDARAWAGPRS